jgi:hypothetical protein
MADSSSSIAALRGAVVNRRDPLSDQSDTRIAFRVVPAGIVLGAQNISPTSSVSSNSFSTLSSSSKNSDRLAALFAPRNNVGGRTITIPPSLPELEVHINRSLQNGHWWEAARSFAQIGEIIVVRGIALPKADLDKFGQLANRITLAARARLEQSGDDNNAKAVLLGIPAVMERVAGLSAYLN